MKVLHLLALVLATSLPAGLTAQAGTFSDAVFAPATLSGAAPLLRYGHEVKLPARPATETGPGTPASTAADVLTLAARETEGKPRLVLEREVDGTTTPITDFGPASAHPMLMFFLESTVRNMADLTGGSPFYIRNRIRDALGQAELGAAGPVSAGALTVEGYEITLTPFAEDQMRARMGEFGALTLRFTLAPDQPARILALSADTIAGGGGYHERMVLLAEGQ